LQRQAKKLEKHAWHFLMLKLLVLTLKNQQLKQQVRKMRAIGSRIQPS